jgi:hypothetical protein
MRDAFAEIPVLDHQRTYRRAHIAIAGGNGHRDLQLCVPKTSSECDAAMESPKLAG